MMKKIFVLTVTASLLLSTSYAFRDVSPNSTLQPAIKNLVDRKVLKDKGFFRADADVPLQMFWGIVLRDGGFDPNSADFGTPLPPNIQETDPLAPFLKEALRRDFIRADEPFNKNQSITRLQAIKNIVKAKGILPPKRNSRTFLRKVSGVSPRSKFLPEVEAALASGLLEIGDIKPLRPYAPLKRRDLVKWLYRFNKHGERKSKLDSPSYKSTTSKKYGERKSTYRPNSHTRSRSRRSMTRKEYRKPVKSLNDLKIEVLPNYSTPSSASSINAPNMAIMESIYQAINTKYRFSEDLNEEKKKELIDAAIAGMVKALDDKYSSYIEPKKAEDFANNLNGNYEGIGAYVEMIEEKMTITSPLKGSPAEKAGIMAGDVITAVDGDSIKDISISDAIDLIRGPEGSIVVITIERNGAERDISVTRGKITVPSITLEWKSSIPVIGIHQFNKKTSNNFEKMLVEEVLPRNPKGIVVDLRNNPGGYLTSATDIGEFFLDQGKLIFSVEYKDSKKEYKARKNGLLNKFNNVVVLTNKGSASASEIFAGMIQDYEIGKIVGSTTLGKGTVQEISNYNNGGTLKLTVAKWLTPKGRWVHEKGIIPDVEIEDPTPEEKKKEIDRQLDTAVNMALRKR